MVFVYCPKTVVECTSECRHSIGHADIDETEVDIEGVSPPDPTSAIPKQWQGPNGKLKAASVSTHAVPECLNADVTRYLERYIVESAGELIYLDDSRPLSSRFSLPPASPISAQTETLPASSSSLDMTPRSSSEPPFPAASGTTKTS